MADMLARMSVPIVILHIGNQPYVKNCVLLNARYNPVILIGDDSNKDMGGIKNIEHVPIQSLATPDLERFKKHFVNYSGNNANYEFLCFARVFYMRRLMELKGLSAIFHTDSDCVIPEPLEPVLSIIRKTHTIAYSLDKNEDPHYMVGCIHNALLTPEFCEKFIQLCFDIYKTKTKLPLIMPKIEHHQKNNVPGGICDMTLYYLLAKERLIDVFDLNQIIQIDGKAAAFEHNLNTASGWRGEITYVMAANRLKKVEKVGDEFFLTEVDGGRKVRALSFHFQGLAKPHMFAVFKNGNP